MRVSHVIYDRFVSGWRQRPPPQKGYALIKEAFSSQAKDPVRLIKKTALLTYGVLLTLPLIDRIIWVATLVFFPPPVHPANSSPKKEKVVKPDERKEIPPNPVNNLPKIDWKALCEQYHLEDYCQGDYEKKLSTLLKFFDWCPEKNFFYFLKPQPKETASLAAHIQEGLAVHPSQCWLIIAKEKSAFDFFFRDNSNLVHHYSDIKQINSNKEQSIFIQTIISDANYHRIGFQKKDKDL